MRTLSGDLKRRTLTNLYNESPQWLTSAHQTLDEAVARAYGWTDYTSATGEGEILQLERLALGIAEIFKAPDPITNVQAASISKFEGALLPNEGKTKWMLLYNSTR